MQQCKWQQKNVYRNYRSESRRPVDYESTGSGSTTLMRHLYSWGGWMGLSWRACWAAGPVERPPLPPSPPTPTGTAQVRAGNNYNGWDLVYLLMRSSLVVGASDRQCRSRNCPGFDPSILRHSGIWEAAEEAVLNIVHRKEKIKIKIPPLTIITSNTASNCAHLAVILSAVFTQPNILIMFIMFI